MMALRWGAHLMNVNFRGTMGVLIVDKTDSIKFNRTRAAFTYLIHLDESCGG